MSAPDLLFLRDLADVEPPRERYKAYDAEDIYKLVPKPQWTGLEDEIWTPRANEDDPQLEKVKQLIKRNASGIEPVPQATAEKDEAAEKAAKAKGKKGAAHVVRLILDNKWVELVLITATLWALFAEDSRAFLARPASDIGDPAFQWIHFSVAMLFAVELIARAVVVPRYFNSFFFWLDIVAVASMVTDFLPVMVKEDDDSVETSATDAARAGRAARAGTKVGRLLRLLRIVRVLKLFLAARKKKHEQLVEVKEYTPSLLGKELKERITQKTIIFVLALLLISALLEFLLDKDSLDFTPTVATGLLYSGTNVTACNNATHGPADLPYYACKALADPPFTDYINSTATPPAEDGDSGQGGVVPGAPGTLYSATDPFFTMRQQMETQFIRWFPFGYENMNLLLRLEMYGLIYYYPSGKSASDWSPGEDPAIDPFLLGQGLDGGPYTNCSAGVFSHTRLCMDRCPKTIWHLRKAERTVFILQMSPYTQEILTGTEEVPDDNLAVIWLSRRPYVLCESLFSIFYTLAVCALLMLMGFLFSRDSDQMVIRPIENMVDSVTKLAANPAYKLEAVKQVKYETDALYVSLAKIAALLQVGFGEAGNNLVAENLKKGDTVDPMVPGKKLLGAYGFCIIDDYEEVLECLGEEILPFTNTAAGIVHTAVSGNGGQPNRNLGEAFLCVWKPRLDTPEPSPAELLAAEMKMCDGALTAFRTCVRKIMGSNTLQAYNEHEEIVKYFDGQYQTVIGYGLHYGWAIEGAVGTNIKIDCSYLSPNVNLAARLESATKMYGVNILMSEYFVSKLSPPVQEGLRRVDVVCLKGSSIPMAIYTDDRSNALHAAQDAVDRYGADQVIPEFKRIFDDAVDSFVKGDWPAAKTALEAASDICPNDKPCKRLLAHMDTPENKPDFGLATTAFEAPEGWPGYHILLSK